MEIRCKHTKSVESSPQSKAPSSSNKIIQKADISMACYDSDKVYLALEGKKLLHKHIDPLNFGWKG